ncbi:hypothetical protein [Ferrovibrio sp.]|uniref:hypothetical protein n=1 Tax=Ferrovibrio sp. TaxID=1917215 RepID=UPI0025BD516B|nr:hypothetical protein [Ferrovibrio sp.]MBX3454406.1 hypothetical protein [Ferrovibrio sp.]
MSGWIDVLSPSLRKLHNDWLLFRGNFMMPDVQDFNTFANAPEVMAIEAASATVMLPMQGDPIFKHVGGLLLDLLPDCRSGMSFGAMRSPISRAAVIGPFMRIARSRQPETRRLQRSSAIEVKHDCEILLLPFADRKLRVCVVHAVYDLSGINWKKAFL